MKVYVGCAIKHAPEEYLAAVFAFKDELRTIPGVEVLDFVGLSSADSRTVYAHDVQCVETCDAFIAFIDEPSLGLGMELGHALHHDKKILCLCRDMEQITRMVLGAGELGLLSIQEYKNSHDALEHARTFLSR